MTDPTPNSTPDSTPVAASDIVTRLRLAEEKGLVEWQVLIDAADEIERLNENLHLIGQLHQGENLADDWLVCIECDYNWPCPTYQLIDSKQLNHG